MKLLIKIKTKNQAQIGQDFSLIYKNMLNKYTLNTHDI